MHPHGDGPWKDEPDKAQWVDKGTGLDALAVRSGKGVWCGYVGVPPDHPWYGKSAEGLPIAGVEVDYSDVCVEGGEDQPQVCHVPEPGRPERVWWLGWHNAHAGDLVPGDAARVEVAVSPGEYVELLAVGGPVWPYGTYRTLEHVRRQVLLVAVQCDDPDGTGLPWRRELRAAA